MGRSKKSRRCPECDSRDVLLQDTFEDGVSLYVCADCDCEFEVSDPRAKHSKRYEEVDDDMDEVPPEYEWER